MMKAGVANPRAAHAARCASIRTTRLSRRQFAEPTCGPHPGEGRPDHDVVGLLRAAQPPDRRGASGKIAYHPLGRGSLGRTLMCMKLPK